jgi:hypothetical protein
MPRRPDPRTVRKEKKAALAAARATAAMPPVDPAKPPSPLRFMDRVEANNYIAKAIGAKRYLEIGCRDDSCFSQIDVEHKVGVDPFQGGTHRMTSDRYFATHRGEAEFDLIFIDGDHRHEQVRVDLANSLMLLAPGGVITMHDVWPFESQFEDPTLCGTVWRAFVHGARTLPGVDAYTAILADPVGLGVLRIRENTAPVPPDSVPAYERLSYADMRAHEHDWMRRLPIDVVFERLEIGT